MTSLNNRPIIGLTMGDPAGIGPEILIKALSDPTMKDICRPVVLGDLTILEKAVRLTGASLSLNPIETPADYLEKDGWINLIPLSDLNADASACIPPTPETGTAAETYILKGTDLAIAKEIDAIVTGPITKTGLKAAGSQFHGHTELIAHRTGTQKFGMMMAGSRLKVVLATIHIPLARVIETLTPDRILEIIDLTHRTMVDRFGVPSPKLAVAGLNPHAGEEGMFGDEESSIIMPAVTQALAKGYTIQGPLPPDTVFFNASQGQFDAVVCMYHDQGLIPFKMTHFRDGVNTTIGLPIIRTSVDHGTAYDIAWQNKADETSLKEAIKMAVHQACHCRQVPPHAQ